MPEIPQALGGSKIISRIEIGKMLDNPGGIWVLSRDQLMMCSFEIKKAVFEATGESIQRQKMIVTLDTINALLKCKTVFQKLVVQCLF